MLPLSSIISNQIRFLLDGATDSSSDSIYRELRQFVEYGTEESILLLQTCLDQLNSGGGDAKISQMQRDFVSAIFKYLLDKPNFCSIFYEALHGPAMSDGFPGDLAKTLNLSTAEKIGVGLALSESENLDFRMRGHNFCIAQIEDLITNPNLGVPNEQIQDIVLLLCRSEGLSKHVDSFTKILSLIPHHGSSFFCKPQYLRMIYPLSTL